MQILADSDFARVVTALAAALAVATTVGRTLQARADSDRCRQAMVNLNARINAWWVMCAVALGALLSGPVGTVILFGLLSLGALREFIALTPAHRGDHRVLLLAFYMAIPLQYALVAANWYGLFAILLPVYGVIILSAAAALAGDTSAFLERLGRIHWGVLVCVYGLSHAPALVMLEIPGDEAHHASLLLYLLVVVESSDVLQYIWGKLFGRRSLAPAVSPGKTLEGFAGGVLSATLVGGALTPLTPFTVTQSALLSFAAVLTGVAGGLVMSAIKRDRGLKDFGTAIPGHGGILDRVDSLCFAAPVFFHLTRCFFAA